MQMIDVMKRLAELDSKTPSVSKTTMKNEQSLATVSNISESVSECGGMMGMANTPASFSINASAQSGDEVASMLTQIMNLAGINKDAGADIELPVSGGEKEIELGAPHGVELDGGNDDMANMIGMIDKMNGDSGTTEPGGDFGGDDATGDDTESVDGFANQDGQQSPIADMADEVQGMADELADKNEGTYDNSPEEEVRGHTYGDDQVTPKPQGFKQRQGDNPYRPVGESVETVTLDLLKAYQAFKAQQ